jgi:molybdate-binding protein
VDPLSDTCDREQLAAIADPTRLCILRRLMIDPATLTQLARGLRSYAARMRHHVKVLESVGLVRRGKTVTTRNYTEKYYEATAAAYAIHPIIVPGNGVGHPTVILGSDDIALEALTRLALHDDHRLYAEVATGSLDGLEALRQGTTDVAGCHLLDIEPGNYNVSFIRHLFPDRPMEAITLVQREQGLMVTPGNPWHMQGVEDLVWPGTRIVNRKPGSGTRSWLDSRLHALGIPHDSLNGYGIELPTHQAVAAAVASGSADAGLGIREAAVEAGLGFVPLFNERYDLVVDTRRADEPDVRHLLGALGAESVPLELDRYGRHAVAEAGDRDALPVRPAG